MQGPFYSDTYFLNNNEVVLTDDILNLPGTIEENMSHYYLGYISDDNMPEFWHMSTVELIDDVITATKLNQNYGWGYIWRWETNDNGNMDQMRGALIYSDNGTKTNTRAYSHHFVNECMVPRVSAQNAFRIYFAIMPVVSNGITPDGTNMQAYWNGHYNTFISKDVTLTYEQIIDFIAGNYTINLDNLNFGQSYYTVSFTGTDFDSITNTVKITGFNTYDGEFTIYVQIACCNPIGNQCYLAGNNQKYSGRLTPFFGAEIKGDGNTIQDQTVLLAPNNLTSKNNTLLQVNFDGLGVSIDTIEYQSGYLGAVGISSMGNYQWVDGLIAEDFYEHYMNNGNEIVGTRWWYACSGMIREQYMVAGLGNNMSARILCPLPISDLKKIATITFNKIETSTTNPNNYNSFTGSQTYTIDYSTAMYNIDTTNTLGFRKTENYADFADELLNWQDPNNDISVDDFSADNIPEWFPPPEPDTEDRGDNIEINTNMPIGIDAFLTNYALSAQNINSVGSQVWQKVRDPAISAMVENFFIFERAFDPSSRNYELNAANIIDYFVSLKYFPFDVAAAAGGTDTLTIYVGTGAEAITLGAYGKKLGKNTVILDGGTARIPYGQTKLPGIDRERATFLDMEPNTTISVFVPFCGTVTLPPSVVANSILSLKYCVDLTTGGCYATIFKNGNKQFPIATINGTVGFEILLTGNNAQTVQANANNAFQNMQIESGSSILSAIKSGIGGYIGMNSGGNSGSGFGLANGIFNDILNAGKTQANFVNNVPELMATQPLRAGSSSTLAGLATPLTAYVQIRRHRANMDNYDSIGFMTDRYLPISGLHGFGLCQITNPVLDGLNCTQTEMEMIRKLLETGVYF